MDCMMPDDGQEILITTKTGIVDKDVNEEDCDYCFLDSGYNWTEDAAAGAISGKRRAGIV